MKQSYDHQKLEAKWQKVWQKTKAYETAVKSAKKKFYALVEFPYPSGDGLHVGHIRSYTGMDVLARKRRMEGKNVLYPIGWDAFGLPTENYAIKTGIQPKIITKTNTDTFRRQLQSLGFSFDWSREINTSDPNYYRFTQWLFLQFFKHGLAYKGKMAINWCPKDKIGLANEEVIAGKCERCGTVVEQREKEQWLLKITKYADRLDKDLDKVDYPESVKIQQRHWIKNLHDWVFSRQRYWGEPIPMIWCPKCEWQPVPEKDLPVKLPEVKEFKPRDDGESPLASLASWVKVKCPKCGGGARRETDVMPNWAGSSWYYLRYLDPDNKKALASPAKLKAWLPVDWYNGGMEHTTLHLLYSRFWHKFLYDIKIVPTSEPYQKRTSHGLILAHDGDKMSKSKGNVVNPDKIVANYGADTLRLYEMFLGPFEQAVSWSEESIIGPRRFLEKVWRLVSRVANKTPKNLAWERVLNQTIQKVSADIETFHFNTAVSSLMMLINEAEKLANVSKTDFEKILLLIAPFAPHLAEELWSELGHTTSIHHEAWPKAKKIKVANEKIKIVIQVNGVVRDVVEIADEVSEEMLKQLAASRPKVVKFLDNKKPTRIIYIKHKLLNFVV